MGMTANDIADSPAPRETDLYIVTVGTSATNAVDLFAYFGIDPVAARDAKLKVTLRPSGGALGFVFGGSAVGTPSLAKRSAEATSADETAGRCSQVEDGAERFKIVTFERRCVRFICDTADTRVELEAERG